MTTSRSEKNKLLVEGDEDKRVVPYLLEEAHILWGDSEDERPVDIQAYNGVDDLLAKGQIETQLKTPRLEALGIIVDANYKFDSRWRHLRDRCILTFPDIPEAMPPRGLICQNDEGLRLGAWIMPDNQTSGMLETFLAYLVPDEGSDIWKFSCETVEKAREKGAPFRENHLDKARIHSWLAVQDPPGQSLHLAIVKRILAPESDEAETFINWFVELFQLEDLRR